MARNFEAIGCYKILYKKFKNRTPIYLKSAAVIGKFECVFHFVAYDVTGRCEVNGLSEWSRDSIDNQKHENHFSKT